MKKFGVAAGLAAAMMLGTSAMATDLEVTHWWTSGGEAAAVAEFAKAFDATGNRWVDGAIGGSGDTARPIIISRIMGGDQPGATQFNPGSDANDLIDAGLILDLTELAEKEGWKDVVKPSSILDPCIRDGKVWCVPVNIHSSFWLWTNRNVFTNLGMEPPKDWNELVAVGPKLREAGIIPLSAGQGWPISTLVDNIEVGVLGVDNVTKIYSGRDMDLIHGDLAKQVWVAMEQARDLIKPEEIVPQWNDAVSLVITGKAAANVMGDWAQGEFQVANQVAGTDYDCLAGMGLNDVASAGGDVFYFPKTDDPERTKAQLELASLMISPAVQVAFNSKKGSMPVRQDVDMSAANACMQKGLKIIQDPGKLAPNNATMLLRETIYAIRDLRNEFMTTDMSADDGYAAWVKIMEEAPAV